jgi:hypothetical protein
MAFSAGTSTRKPCAINAVSMAWVVFAGLGSSTSRPSIFAQSDICNPMLECAAEFWR